MNILTYARAMSKKYTMTVNSVFNILGEAENQTVYIKELLAFTLESTERDYITNSLCQLFCVNRNIVDLLDKLVIEAPGTKGEKTDDGEEMIMGEATLNSLEMLIISRYYWTTELKRLNYSLLEN